ncbi:hypothetical protein FXF61_07795 [Pseudomonas sp. C27(2019)]|uniref:DUF5610 domain-containing protein n=1 Tax=Pseudomonas sp. C27(2019) TaxID=2604941 RepID=UPI001245AF54|nr:DUF5610 domain-containing protein [Pseudomonas sp. C27(2019)]QEY59081.1 hypothetical protein FXF61_07795 [Pseudomonas sp. C27(2019)]
MTTPIVPTQSGTASNVSKAGPQATPQSSELDEARKAAASSPEGQRTQLGAKILQASLDVSISAGDNSMALLYRTAIDNINELLAPEFGPNALQAAMHQDNSPEATADRILSQSTAFFDAYARQHPNKDPEETVRDFVSIIRGGFEKGYAEAAEILTGLGVMGEGSPIAAEIGKTFELVQKGYDDFLQNRLQALQEQKPDEQAPDSTTV